MMRYKLLLLCMLPLIFFGCRSSSGAYGRGAGKGAHSGRGKGADTYIVKKEMIKISPSHLKGSSTQGGQRQGRGKLRSSVPFLFPIGFTFDGKPLFLLKTVSLSSTQVTLNVWDDALEDGDIITLYLNDRPIVSNYKLKNAKFSVKASLKKGKENTLYLYAHNLGQYPPNTAAIELVTDKESRNFTLSSTLEASQGVTIHVK